MINVTKLSREICLLHLQDAMATQQEAVALALSASIQELNYHAGFNVISREFLIPSSFIIEMPDDCISVIKVGVLCGDSLRVMGTNNSIKRDKEIQKQCSCSDTTTCDYHTFHNYSTGLYSEYLEAYGAKQNQFPNGYYRYKRQTNSVVFGSGTDVYDGNTVIIEYQTSLNGESIALIPTMYKPVITYHALSIYFMGTNPGQSAFYRQQMRASADLIKRTLRPDLQDIVGVLRGEALSAPR